MGKRWVLLLALSGVAACTGGSLANKDRPTATGGTVTPTGGNVATPDGGGVIGDAMAGDGATGDAKAGAATDGSPDVVKDDPLGAAPTCTSQTTWTKGENSSMAPGQACITCHRAEGEGPLFPLAGTLYPTGHEPDDCNGVNGALAGARIVVTGANGGVVTLTPNAAGNFYATTQPISFPYKVKVVNALGEERVMLTATSNGDCNACHTQAGASGAPGRVTVP
jgi:cytochrome c553